MAENFKKDPLVPCHGDSIADQSFQSLKSKEIRDSTSPTNDFKFHSVSLNQPNNAGWDVQTSSEISPDGKSYKTNTVATTDGVESIKGGVAEFKGRNEQKSSASHKGDDKNFVKEASESNKTHMHEKVVIGNENDGRTEMRVSSSTSSSSHKVVSSSSTSGNHDLPPQIENIRDQHHHHELEDKQHREYALNREQQHTRERFEKQERLERQERQQREEHHSHQQTSEQRHEEKRTTESSQNVQEQTRKLINVDKASPEYQKHVQYLMSQPGEIISNTVEYPKPNVKMITTVKKLPDGTIVKNKRYETEEIRSAADNKQHHRSDEYRNQNTERHQHQNIQKNSNRNVNNQQVTHSVPERYVDDSSNVETTYSTSSVKKSSRRFSTETTSETVQEHDDQQSQNYTSQSKNNSVDRKTTARDHKTPDFSTHGFPSVKPHKPTQEFANHHPQSVVDARNANYADNGEVVVVSSEKRQTFKNTSNRTQSTQIEQSDNNNTFEPSTHQKVTEYSNTKPGSQPKDYIVSPRGIPQTAADVHISEKKFSTKHKAERETVTEYVLDDENNPNKFAPIKHSQHHTADADFSTHGFPSTRDQIKKPLTKPIPNSSSTTDSTTRLIQKEKEVDNAHRAFAASLRRSASPADQTDNHRQHSAKPHRRDMREGSHDSETSRISSRTVTHPPNTHQKNNANATVKKQTTIKTKTINDSNEIHDRATPATNKSTTTTKITTVTKKVPIAHELPKPDNRGEHLLPINEPLTKTKQNYINDAISTPTPPINEVIEKPCIKKYFYQLGPSDNTTAILNAERSSSHSPAMQNAKKYANTNTNETENSSNTTSHKSSTTKPSNNKSNKPNNVNANTTGEKLEMHEKAPSHSPAQSRKDMKTQPLEQLPKVINENPTNDISQVKSRKTNLTHSSKPAVSGKPEEDEETTIEIQTDELINTELPDGGFASKPIEEINTTTFRKKGLSRRETFEERCRQILGMENEGETQGKYRDVNLEDETEPNELLTESLSFDIKRDDLFETQSIHSIRNNQEINESQKLINNEGRLVSKNDTPLVDNNKESKNSLFEAKPSLKKVPLTSDDEPFIKITPKNPSKKDSLTTDEPLKKTTSTKSVPSERTSKSPTSKNTKTESEMFISTDINKSRKDNFESSFDIDIKHAANSTFQVDVNLKRDNATSPEVSTPTTNNKKKTTLPKKESLTSEESLPKTAYPKKSVPIPSVEKPLKNSSPKKQIADVNTTVTHRRNVANNAKIDNIESSTTIDIKESQNNLIEIIKDAPTIESSNLQKSPKKTTTVKKSSVDESLNDTKSITTQQETRKTSKSKEINSKTSSTIKERLRSAQKSKHSPDRLDSNQSSPKMSPTSERRRSSNISVCTEIIIEHAGNKTESSPNNKDKVTEKPNRKLPVTERKESAPVNRVTRRDKDITMTRSTSENIIKPKSKPMNSLKPEGSPKFTRHPNKCFTTKTINLSTNINNIHREDVDSVIIDIQHAKSSREPSPDKIIPTPVPNDFVIGKPRYPDAVQEPEDEPRKKSVVTNVPIFEEETNELIGCSISEINEVKSTYCNDILINPTVEAPISLDYPSLEKQAEECVFTVAKNDTNTDEENITELITVRPDQLSEDDDCLLTVNEKVSKFSTTVNSMRTTKEHPRHKVIDSSSPQKSPQLVAKIERSISKLSETENSDVDTDQEPSTPFTKDHTTKIELKRQKNILSRPSVFQNNSEINSKTKSTTKTESHSITEEQHHQSNNSKINVNERSQIRQAHKDIPHIVSTISPKPRDSINPSFPKLGTNVDTNSNKSTKQSITSLTESTFNKHNQNKDSNTVKHIVDIKSTTPILPTSNRPVKQTIAARRDIFEKHNITSKAPLETGRRPSYMDHTKSSLEHFRRDSLEINKNNYSRKSSVEDEQSPDETRPNSAVKFTVPQKSPRREQSISEEINIEMITDIEVLEKMLETVTSYELRRRIRAQIKLLKKKLLESPHNGNDDRDQVDGIKNDVKKHDRIVVNESDWVIEKSTKQTKTAQNKILNKNEKTTRSKSPDLSDKFSKKDSDDTKKKIQTNTVRSKSPEHTTPRERSPCSKASKHNEIKQSLTSKRTTTTSRSQSPDKTDNKTPIWANRNNILKNPSTTVQQPKKPSTISQSSRTITTQQRIKSSNQRKNTEEDCITSSYGIGPTDENGLPLFGIRALKKKNKTTEPCDTKEEVTGYVIEEHTYMDSKSSKPTVERKELIYSTNSKELENIKTHIEKNQVTANDNESVERSFKKIESNMEDKTDAMITDLNMPVKTYARRGSVKEISDKFIRNESSQTQSSKSSTYPKAGLIYRTNSRNGSFDAGECFETTSESYSSTTSTQQQSRNDKEHSLGETSKELFYSTKDDENEQQDFTKQSSSSMSSKSFLNSSSESKVVTGLDDIIQRMRNADNVIEDGDTAEDQEARSLLNKFLGASVIMSGVETMLPNKSKQNIAHDTETAVKTNQKEINSTSTSCVTKTITSSESSSSPVTLAVTCDIEEIWNEDQLKKLLEQAATYEERRKIRSRLRELMADREEKAQTSVASETTETKEKDGSVVKTTTTTKVTTRTSSGTAQPISPVNKFKQLDKQATQQSPKSPSTPGSASSTGSAPIFKFTDPALNARAASVKDQLLQWCQQKTQEYENVEITNFSTSWNNGLAFCALIHHFLPDAFDYSKLTPKSRRHNFELAFTVADEKGGIAPLLDVEDMVVMQRPDWKCVFIYVQSIYRRFRNCQ